MITLHVADAALTFAPVPLLFQDVRTTNVFALKNNKTVVETLSHRRYAHLAPLVAQHYSHRLHEPLGTFLLSLKLAGDSLYQRFLNRYGDQTYCTFTIQTFLRERGLYVWFAEDALHYIGRSHDPFGKRINHGYGRIAPKNCYLDGQATNCHLNALIAAQMPHVALYVCPIATDAAIDDLERELIQHYRPLWNIALKVA